MSLIIRNWRTGLLKGEGGSGGESKAIILAAAQWERMEERRKEDQYAIPIESSQHGGQSHGRQKESFRETVSKPSSRRGILNFRSSI